MTIATLITIVIVLAVWNVVLTIDLHSTKKYVSSNQDSIIFVMNDIIDIRKAGVK